MTARAFAAALAALALPAFAHHGVTGEDVAFEQHVGAQLPMKLSLVDDAGRGSTLGAAIGGKPAVLVMGYLACKDLCPITLGAVQEALHGSGLEAGRDYRALFVDVDPREVAILGDEKPRRIAKEDRAAWTFLGGDGANVAELAKAAGFRYRRDEEHDAFAHAAGFVVLTPAGAVSRYFFGVRFEPGEVAVALREAKGGGIGALATRLVLLCYHFDPLTGRYTLAILDILRAMIAAFLAAAAIWAWRMRARKARP